MTGLLPDTDYEFHLRLESHAGAGALGVAAAMPKSSKRHKHTGKEDQTFCMCKKIGETKTWTINYLTIISSWGKAKNHATCTRNVPERGGNPFSDLDWIHSFWLQ